MVQVPRQYEKNDGRKNEQDQCDGKESTREHKVDTIKDVERNYDKEKGDSAYSFRRLDKSSSKSPHDNVSSAWLMLTIKDVRESPGWRSWQDQT
jgi:hypothetical protein